MEFLGLHFHGPQYTLSLVLFKGSRESSERNTGTCRLRVLTDTADSQFLGLSKRQLPAGQRLLGVLGGGVILPGTGRSTVAFIQSSFHSLRRVLS